GAAENEAPREPDAGGLDERARERASGADPRAREGGVELGVEARVPLVERAPGTREALGDARCLALEGGEDAPPHAVARARLVLVRLVLAVGERRGVEERAELRARERQERPHDAVRAPRADRAARAAGAPLEREEHRLRL